MKPNEACPPEHQKPSLSRALLSTLWQQPLYAIPFALFFGTLYGATREAYWTSLKLSLVFAFTIRLAMVALVVWVLPILRRRLSPTGRLPITIEAPAYMAASILGSYTAALLIHRFLIPGFLGSPRAIAVSGAYTVLFTITFSGIAYAIAFYRESIARAHAIEGMRVVLAEAELRALRAQVQPHFLFNTLNTIAALVRVNPAEAEDTITRLADVFRYSLRASDHAHARLSDELEFVRSYLEIERTRFGERLRVTEHIEPGLESLAVPSLLLQPLVENAVRYAVAPRAEGGTVGLAARRDGDFLVLEVSDDGPGMNDTTSASGNGFGLHSVRERLRAAGPPHALDIQSAPGAGTRIRVTIPIPNAEGASQ
jgi:signal transduction histidine kinase